jgi:hypothetical protein
LKLALSKGCNRVGVSLHSLEEEKKTSFRKAVFFSIFAKYNWNYKIETDDVGGTCGTNGGEKERV